LSQKGVPTTSSFNYDTVWEFRQLGPDQHHLALWKLLTAVNPDVVVCERFQSRPNIGGNGTVNLMAPEYIGVAKLYCTSTETDFVLQQPSAAKGLWTDQKIKTLNLWQPNQKHAMDALRHALYYLTVTLQEEHWVQQLRQVPAQ
jgi:hypothetical protein